jgi:hypothetical protein
MIFFLFQESLDHFADVAVARSFQLKQLDDAKVGENDFKAWKSKAELYQVLNSLEKDTKKQHSKTNMSL